MHHVFNIHSVKKTKLMTCCGNPFKPNGKHHVAQIKYVIFIFKEEIYNIEKVFNMCLIFYKTKKFIQNFCEIPKKKKQKNVS